ncbi:B3 DNA binding domain containing protein [Parasponia andersonii]|uniref:B3 DNA binding domain containing protein n=1 Tax=Parasponia andersonii TaxID=3476 RepID=A0A2P5BQR5_PARAD|nr:B3 DNA binding domain containing protein [Parasponia andersonii]
MQFDLPKKFVLLHGEALCNVVFLKLPCGQQWEIGLLKSHGKVYLQQGWPKFTKHYRLDYGHLLFFRYEGKSHFSVSICGLSTCEIDYLSIPAHSDGNLGVPIREQTEEDDSVLLPTSPAHQRMRSSGSDKFRKSKKGIRRTYKSYRDSRAFAEASSFSSSNPFFKKVVRDHPSACYNLRLPDKFVNGHIEKKTQIVKLQVGANHWDVKLLRCESGFFFSGGWSKFLAANFLHPGDVCVYD